MLAVERVPLDRAVWEELCLLLIAMHKEVGTDPIDPVNAGTNIWRAMSEGRTIVVREAGAIVGSIAMVEMPVWYAGPEVRCLIDQWFYVGAAHRFGAIGGRLLLGARQMAGEAGMRAYVRIMNPRRRPAGGEEAAISTIAGFDPFAKTVRIR